MNTKHKRVTRKINEEFFMMFSWTHHVMELGCQQEHRDVLTHRACHVESTTGSWIVKRRPKYICHSTSSGDRAVRDEILHVLRGVARERLDRHTAWGRFRT
jgi:hypothetical protein